MVIRSGLILLCFCLFCAFRALSSPRGMNLIQDNGDPSPIFVQLFKALDLLNDGTVADFNKIAQEKFLRKPDQERWKMKDVYRGQA